MRKKQILALADSVLQTSPPIEGTPESDKFWGTRPEIKTLANPHQNSDIISQDKYDELEIRADLSLDKYQKQLARWIVFSITCLLGGESASFSAYLSTTIWGNTVTPSALPWIIGTGVFLFGITSYKLIKAAAIEIRVNQHKSKIKQWLQSGDAVLKKKATDASDLMSAYYTSAYEPDKRRACSILGVYLFLFFIGVGVVRGVDIRADDIAITRQFKLAQNQNYSGFDSNEVALPDENTSTDAVEGGVDTASTTTTTTIGIESGISSYSPVFFSLILSISILFTTIMILWDMVHRVKLILTEDEWKIIYRHKNKTIHGNNTASDLATRRQNFQSDLLRFEHIFHDRLAKTNVALIGKYPPMNTINPSDYIY